MTATPVASTFSQYWDTVMGPSRSAEDCVSEFDLVPADLRSFEEWVGEAQEMCRAQGAAFDPATVAANARRAARDLRAAASVVAVG